MSQTATAPAPRQFDNSNEGAVWPRYENQKFVKFDGTVKVGGIQFNVTLTPANTRDSKEYFQVSGGSEDKSKTISGALFTRQAVKEGAPRYSGPIEINKGRPDEIKKEMAAWERKSNKDQSPFLSLKVQDRWVKPS